MVIEGNCMIALSRMLLRTMANATIGQCDEKPQNIYISCKFISNTTACTEKLSIYVLLASALLVQPRIVVIFSFFHFAIPQSTYLARTHRPIKTNPDTPNQHLQAQSHRTRARIRENKSNINEKKKKKERDGMIRTCSIILQNPGLLLPPTALCTAAETSAH